VSSNLTASAISGTRRYVFSKLVKNSGKPLLKCAQSIKSDLGSGHLKYNIKDLIKSVTPARWWVTVAMAPSLAASEGGN
jgi:hypothetical protein